MDGVDDGSVKSVEVHFGTWVVRWSWLLLLLLLWLVSVFSVSGRGCGVFMFRESVLGQFTVQNLDQLYLLVFSRGRGGRLAFVC